MPSGSGFSERGTAALVAGKTYRWGVCAAGNISNDFTNCLNKLSHRTEVVAIAARNKTRAEGFAQRHKIKKVYGAYEELFQDDEVDIVYVGAIHTEHCRLAIAALEAGKHVVVEKPLGMNLKEVDQMQAAAKKAGKLLLEGLWTRFFPVVREVREVIRSGAIGSVKNVTADFGIVISREVERIWKLEMGGGGLLDLGVYPIAAVLDFLLCDEAGEDVKGGAASGGEIEPLDVKVVGVTDEATGVDMCGTLSLQYPGGKTGSATYSCVNTTPEDVVISGEAGYIRIHGPAHCPTSYTVSTPEGRRGFKHAEKTIDGYLSDDFSGMPAFVYPHSEGFVFEVEGVYKALDAGKLECAEYSWADTRRICGLMDKMRSQMGVVYKADAV